MENNSEKLIEFCSAVERGLGTITDSSVRKEFERVNETIIVPEDLGKLLALLEKNNLLDKRNSVNKEPSFYQFMYKKMKSLDAK